MQMQARPNELAEMASNLKAELLDIEMDLKERKITEAQAWVRILKVKRRRVMGRKMMRAEQPQGVLQLQQN